MFSNNGSEYLPEAWRLRHTVTPTAFVQAVALSRVRKKEDCISSSHGQKETLCEGIYRLTMIRLTNH